eukprot:719057-Pyramimonas_sp.AAC.1
MEKLICWSLGSACSAPHRGHEEDLQCRAIVLDAIRQHRRASDQRPRAVRNQIGDQLQRLWALLAQPGHVALSESRTCRVHLVPHVVVLVQLQAALAQMRRRGAQRGAVLEQGIHIACVE